MLFRQLGNGLYGMAECLYLLESWQEALQEIETALILHNNQSYVWLKLKITFEIMKGEPTNFQIIKGLKKEIEAVTEVPDI